MGDPRRHHGGKAQPPAYGCAGAPDRSANAARTGDASPVVTGGKLVAGADNPVPDSIRSSAGDWPNGVRPGIRSQIGTDRFAGYPEAVDLAFSDNCLFQGRFEAGVFGGSGSSVFRLFKSR
jgi:hypothetical protein